MYRPLICLPLLAACAGSLGDARFPSRADLERIAQAPPPSKLARGGVADVAEWSFTGPLPSAIDAAPHHDGSRWQALLEEAKAATPESMHCVARESGLFFLEKRALPSERLSQFLAARCGVGSVEVSLNTRFADAPDSVSEDALFDSWRPAMNALLSQLLRGGPRLAGIWFGRRDGHAVVAVSASPLRARLDAQAMAPNPDGSVTVSGELLEPADHVEALINHGSFGFARCATDVSVRVPRFRVTCNVDLNDPRAWIEVGAFPPGRVLGRNVASFIVWPRGAESSYHPEPYVNRTVPAGGDARRQLLDLLNEVRRTAGLPAVTLAERESMVADRVAPHYFAAILGNEPVQVAEQVVLGLRAGWDVDGDVRLGNFMSSAVLGDDLGRLLDTALERPSARETLLAPSALTVALGTVTAPEPKVTALIATSYELFDGVRHDHDAERVLEQLSQARARHQFAPPQLLTNLSALGEEAVAAVHQGRSPRSGLQDLLERCVDKLGGTTPVRGWVLEANTLDDIAFPGELAEEPLGGVAITVSHYRPAGSPWSRLIIFIVATNGGLRV